MKELADEFRALKMVDFAFFCYILGAQLDIIEENMLLNEDSLSFGVILF